MSELGFELETVAQDRFNPPSNESLTSLMDFDNLVGENHFTAIFGELKNINLSSNVSAIRLDGTIKISVTFTDAINANGGSPISATADIFIIGYIYRQ